MSHYFIIPAQAGEGAGKVDLLRGRQLFLGLNRFQPGQSQALHVHADSDKFYLVLSGKARMIVGEETREVCEGTLIWAPADIPHGVAEILEPAVMLVGMAPPPGGIRPPAEA